MLTHFLVYLCVAVVIHGTRTIPFQAILSKVTKIDDDDRLHPLSNTNVLILDVDGTLYSTSGHPEDIEMQIRSRGYAYFDEYLNISSAECDDLYEKHGSIIAAIPTTEMLLHYFYEVYSDLSYSQLRCYSMPSDVGGFSLTGYSLIEITKHRAALNSLLALADSGIPIVIASNSPSSHVYQILDKLGLSVLKLSLILTPDKNDGLIKSNPMFWDPLLEKFPLNKHNLTLIDDSPTNIAVGKQIGLTTIEVNKDVTFSMALIKSLGLLPVENMLIDHAVEGSQPFAFNPVAYLRAKNALDDVSFNKDVMSNVSAEVLKLRRDRTFSKLSSKDANNLNSSFVVIDLGAGVLNMLRQVLMLANELLDLGDSFKRLTYVAFENNLELLEFSKNKLSNLGFHECSDEYPDLPGCVCFQLNLPTKLLLQPMEISIFLVPEDFTSIQALTTLEIIKKNGKNTMDAVDLIIGCCVADLLPPTSLCCVLQDMGGREGCLAYLPITFTGATTIVPSSACDAAHVRDIAYHYDQHLRASGHHLSQSILMDSLQNYGFIDISYGRSDWEVRFQDNRYLWLAMYSFIVQGALFPMLALEASISEKILATFRTFLTTGKNDIIARNIDILLRVPPLGSRAQNIFLPHIHDYYIEFTDIRKLKVVRQALLAPSASKVLIRSLCSLVSTGTELKIFRGEFEAEQPVDLTIEGLSDTPMAYPLRYGYCMVGKSVKVKGDDTIFDDKLLFVFSPHGQFSLISPKDIIIVPANITEEDAVFAPSVETAVSLVHDANPLIGEKIAIVGQGLIGILTAAVLATMGLDVTVVDVSDERLTLSTQFTPTLKTWNPKTQDMEGKFDVCIELTGRMAGLQTAIDKTAYGGRVIIGSWYSKAESIKLGTVFHRSHITLKSSQVSNIPARFTDRWTKPRRFSLTWDILRMIKPSKLLLHGSRKISFNKIGLENIEKLESEVIEAYDRLERGLDMTALFDYRDYDDSSNGICSDSNNAKNDV